MNKKDRKKKDLNDIISNKKKWVIFDWVAISLSVLMIMSIIFSLFGMIMLIFSIVHLINDLNKIKWSKEGLEDL